MPAVQPKEELIEFLRRSQDRVEKDLRAISADQAKASPGGVAKTALYMVAECAAVNGLVAKFLTEGTFQRPSPEERDAFLSQFDTVEKALDFLQAETAKLIGVIEGLDENTLGDRLTGPFGYPMTRFAVAQLPGMHMSYHDGQLNYIQSLHGDGEIHW